MPLDVLVVVNRYQGGKRVSSLPYTMAVNANDRTISGPSGWAPAWARWGSGRVGQEQPGFRTSNFSKSTNIDCFARTMDDGQFQVNLIIDDSSIYENVPRRGQAQRGRQLPRARSFKSTNTLVLRDGQTRQFTAATGPRERRGGAD